MVEQKKVTRRLITLYQLIKLQNIHYMVTNENITMLKPNINKLVQIKQQKRNYKINRLNINA